MSDKIYATLTTQQLPLHHDDLLPHPLFIIQQNQVDFSVTATITNPIPGAVYKLKCDDLDGEFWNKMVEYPLIKPWFGVASNLGNSGTPPADNPLTRGTQYGLGGSADNQQYYGYLPSAFPSKTVGGYVDYDYDGSTDMVWIPQIFDRIASYQYDVGRLMGLETLYYPGYSHDYVVPAYSNLEDIINSGRYVIDNERNVFTIDTRSVSLENPTLVITLFSKQHFRISDYTLDIWLSNQPDDLRQTLANTYSGTITDASTRIFTHEFTKEQMNRYDKISINIVDDTEETHPHHNQMDFSIHAYFIGGLPGSQDGVNTVNFMTDYSPIQYEIDRVEVPSHYTDSGTLDDYAPRYSVFDGYDRTDAVALSHLETLLDDEDVDFPMVLVVAGQGDITDHSTGIELLEGNLYNGPTYFLVTDTDYDLVVSPLLTPTSGTAYAPGTRTYHMHSDGLTIGQIIQLYNDDNEMTIGHYLPVFNIDTNFSEQLNDNEIYIPGYYFKDFEGDYMDCHMRVHTAIRVSEDSPSHLITITPFQATDFEYPETEITTDLGFTTDITPSTPLTPGITQPDPTTDDVLIIDNTDIDLDFTSELIREPHGLIRDSTRMSFYFDNLYSVEPECTFYSIFGLSNKSFTSTFVNGSYTATLDVHEKDTIDISCDLIDNGESKIFLTRSNALAPVYLDILSSIKEDNVFGWQADGSPILGVGIVGVITIFVSMSAFNRFHLPTSLGMFTAIYLGAAFFEIIDIPQALTGILLMFLIIGIFSRGHR